VVERDAESGEMTADEIGRAGGEALAIRADVTDAPAVERAVDAVVAEWGRLERAGEQCRASCAMRRWQGQRRGLGGHPRREPARHDGVQRAPPCGRCARRARPRPSRDLRGRAHGNYGQTAYAASKAASSA